MTEFVRVEKDNSDGLYKIEPKLYGGRKAYKTKADAQLFADLLNQAYRMGEDRLRSEFRYLLQIQDTSNQ